MAKPDAWWGLSVLENNQLGLCPGNPNCLFAGYIPQSDTRCFEFGKPGLGYDVVDENSPDLHIRLAEIRGIDFSNVKAQKQTVPLLPDFMPIVKPGGEKLYRHLDSRPVGLMLQNIVSPQKLFTPKNLDSLRSALPNSPFILLNYGRDQLLENMWPRLRGSFKKLSQLGIAATTGINFSVWDNQPHPEALINLKRSLLTFAEWQILGVPSIVHIYWYSRFCLKRWSEWLKSNPEVKIIAINLQTIRSKSQWDATIDDLRYFSKLISSRIHVLLTGPSTPARIAQCLGTFPNCTISNKYALQLASSSKMLNPDNFKPRYSSLDKAKIAAHNVMAYDNFIKSIRQGARFN